MCIAHEKIHTEIIFKKTDSWARKEKQIDEKGKIFIGCQGKRTKFFVVVDNFPIDVTSLKTTFVDGLRKRRIKNNAESRGSATVPEHQQ